MLNRFNFFYAVTLVAFWGYVTVGFITEELLPPLEPLRPLVYGVCDILVALSGLSLMTRRSDRLIFGSFMVIAIASMFANHMPLGTTLNGLRDFIGIIFAMPLMRYFLSCSRAEEFRRRFDRQLLIYLVVQAVCITEQFLRYGANDHGGGSWGNFQSGIVSTSIYVVSFYLMTRRWDSSMSYIRNLWNNRLLLFLLYPTLLNETKVSFVFLLMYFVLLLELNRRFLLRLLALTPVLIIGLLGVGWGYLSATGVDADEIFSYDILDTYMFGGDEAEEFIEITQMAQDDPTLELDNNWTVDLPRFTKLALLPDVMSRTGGGMWLGAGLGQFKGSTVAGTTQFSRENEWIIRGTRPFSMFLIMQLGYIGLIWFIITILSDTALKTNTYGPLGLNVKWYFLMVVLCMLFYNEALRAMPLCLLMFYPLAQTVATPRPKESDPSPSLPQTYADSHA